MNDITQLYSNIIQEGMDKDSLNDAWSILCSELIKQGADMNNESSVKSALEKLILSQDVDYPEQSSTAKTLLLLSAQFQFEQGQLGKRPRLAQQIHDFETGKNKVVFSHPINGQKIGPFDKKTMELVIKTRAMMLFPDPEHRAIRERLSNAPAYNLSLPNDEKTIRLVEKRYIRIKIIGVVFKVQCEHWAYARKKRSFNIVMEAANKGFFDEWGKVSMKIETARKHWATFKRVRHLLAADLALTWTDKKLNPGADRARVFDLPFTSFIADPGRFFSAADRYRQWALDAGMIKRKNELWMPKNWKTLTRDLPTLEEGDIDPEYDGEIKRFDEIERWYREEKGWMT